MNAVDQALSLIKANRRLNTGIKAMRTRMADFDNALQAALAGTAVVPEARTMMEHRIAREWQRPRPLPGGDREIIIGAGYHAAVYAAARVKAGNPRPAVLEASETVGGAFAMGEFWLNSRNQPGASGVPGNADDGLNYLPGAPVQTAHFATGKFDRSDDMRFVIWLTLARYADVFTKAQVVGLSPFSNGERGVAVELADGRVRPATQVVDARGMGTARIPSENRGDRILTFPQLLARMRMPFPLHGMNRLAFIGDGNSVRCALESVLGLSPAAHMSCPALDYPRRIDVFAPKLAGSRDGWRSSERGRYQAVGSFLNGTEGGVRVRVLPIRGFPVPAGDQVVVNGLAYDYAIYCCGFGGVPDISGGLSGSTLVAGGCARKDSYYNYLQIGPMADLPFSDGEQCGGGPGATDAERKVAMYRLAPRTVAAAQLVEP